MLNSNEPIKVAHLQKLANQSVLHGAHVIEMVFLKVSQISQESTCVEVFF